MSCQRKDQKQARFERQVQTMAVQLRCNEQASLPSILRHPSLLPLKDRVQGIETYDSLFELMVASQLIAADDFAVLVELLSQLKRQDLLLPLYADLGGATNRLDDVELQSASKFRFLLHSIGNSISSENLQELLFLVRDLLPRRKIDTIKDGHELLELVRRRNCIDYTRPEFLYSFLGGINREDLQQRVDEYVHVTGATLCINQPLPNRVVCRQEESFEWFKQSFEYRLSLKQLADKLEERDLEAMKHFCTGLVPKVQLEKITHVLELFIALEDYGKLSKNDMSILEEILPEKKHFLHPFYTQTDSRQTAVQHQTINKVYKETLRKIGIELRSKEIKALIALQDERNSTTESITTGSQLLQNWEELGLLSQENTEFLRRCLSEIGRSDLADHVITYDQQWIKDHEQECSQVHPERKPIPTETPEFPIGMHNFSRRGNNCCKNCHIWQNDAAFSRSGFNSSSLQSDPLVQLSAKINELERQTLTQHVGLLEILNVQSQQLIYSEQRMRQLKKQLMKTEKKLALEQKHRLALEHERRLHHELKLSSVQREIKLLCEMNKKLECMLYKRNVTYV